VTSQPKTARQVLAQPYVWPYDGDVGPAHTALLVFTGDVPDRAPIGPMHRLAGLAAKLRGAGVTLVHLPRQGNEDAVLPFVPDLTIVRPKLGAFWGSDVDLVLRNRGLTHLLFAGFPFELGADCTMREANDLGYECLAVTDCSSGLAPDTYAGAIKSVTMSGGIFGAIASSEEVLKAFQSNWYPEVPGSG
jgi:isochorismate hydrolase